MALMWRWMAGMMEGLATHSDRATPLARIMQSFFPRYAVIRQPEALKTEYPLLQRESEYSGDAVREMMNDNVWLAVPKRKTSVMKRRFRRHGKALKPIHHYERCFSCGDLKLRHRYCKDCPTINTPKDME
uniref:Large ribosomal subunit protein bL32m n=1 Tax=Paramoeba aestuarina TaxID=180227 RepID=A0A7S4UCK1_9EUKA|mmetsp:Transcript_34713/g.54149  ORF Transcript_34713/g.54149 Transcript_34713/m.54149 type:complete len:130 (+) Transcript_34713:99-488(+)